ncbi:hypothetical protein XENOCAPTIV_024612 [Xenoophorus captivus]|uniref:Uncharacterized protein n=1 Tax=Xenoophorus captivus TaxID=1517983 RepID=A0ABV0S314_9TELE
MQERASRSGRSSITVTLQRSGSNSTLQVWPGTARHFLGTGMRTPPLLDNLFSSVSPAAPLAARLDFSLSLFAVLRECHGYLYHF